MSVEYFTPSEEDTRIAHLWLKHYKMWSEYFNDYDGDIIGRDEKKDASLIIQPPPISIEFTGMMDFGESVRARDLARKIIARIKPEDSNDAIISEFVLPSQPIPPTFNPKFGKDFTPVPAQSVMPYAQISPTYTVRVMKNIDGKKFIFYGQEFPKDK